MNDSSTHHEETNPNCTIVKVIGFGKALRMLFEDVFESADVRYLDLTPHTQKQRKKTLSKSALPMK
jgi:hypothetical protein